MASPLLAQKPRPTPTQVIHHKKEVKALEIKKIVKPKEADIQWQKVVVGQQEIDGATLLGVPKDSVWRRMGLRQGDIIIRMNDTDLHSSDDLNKAVKKLDKKTDSTLNLEIIRQNQVILLDYKLNW